MESALTRRSMPSGPSWGPEGLRGPDALVIRPMAAGEDGPGDGGASGAAPRAHTGCRPSRSHFRRRSFSFSLPQVRSRLERLMGSNYVSLTDRNYMQKLQQRILEDYSESMDKRIKVREEEEMERVKNLVLVGKIPLDQAPKEMAKHPVMLIENYCNQLIAERRAKIKIPKVNIPTYLYWDDTPDPPSGLSIEKGHVFRKAGEKLCHPIDVHLHTSEEEAIEAGYVMPADEYERVKYEDPLVKRLLECETVEEMYELADEIIGILKTIDDSNRTPIPEDSLVIETIQPKGSF